MAQSGGIDAKKLKGFVDRIENLETEAKALGTDKRDVFDEAHEAGVDKKALRRALRDRKEAAKDKATGDLAEHYRALLDEPGATVRSVAAAAGTSKSKVQRLVPRNKNGTPPPHDPETGEITNASPRLEASQEAAPFPTQPEPEGGEGTGTIEPCGGVEVADTHSQPCAGGETRGESRSGPAAVNPQADVAPGPQEPFTDEIDWDAVNATQPSELRRLAAGG